MIDRPSYKQSAALLERARKVLAGGVSSEFRKFSFPHALFYKEGNGSRITDVDGNQYLDFTLSQGPLILGHSHPAVLQAVNAYSQEGQLFAGQHIQEIELAEKLNQLIPSAELMRFCLDGSEAVQTALRVARAKTGRQRFLRFEGHYHGWLDNVAWAISAPSEAALGDRKRPEVYPWSEGLPANTRGEFRVLPWNDLELLGEVLEKEHNDIAAIITEPVMCNSGCIMPQKGFLRGLRELCDQYGIALIFDEVITGFRLGLGGAQGFYGVTPDLSIFAKAMGSGYPISAVVGKRSWMKLIEDGVVIHAGTMNSGNPSVAAALATINELDREQPYERMFALGKRLMEGLRKLAKAKSLDVLVDGPGPMFHIAFTDLNELRDYRDTLASDKSKLGRFIAGMHNQRVRIIGRGLWYISTAHTEDDIGFALDAAAKVFDEL
ncbi:aspartate aminotransferase family protein [Parapedobacter soli]|uniref:aspartate aminotransferase family protein n=1 Tax=Parapedobacter soli TaxID=416955 RepID=UPI0021C90465|nr:aspartate aminotransferase family protein [Parapedobacter soli]